MMKKYRLGEIGEVCMCKRIMKNETNELSGIPFYKIGTFGGTADVFISKEKFEDYKAKYSYPKKGDILISAAGTIGRTVIYNGENAYFQDSNIVWINNDETKVLNPFLFYAYKNVHWKISNGSTILRLYNDDLKATEIVAPSLPEQERIAKVLSDIDSKIALNKKINRELETMAKEIYDYWFVQFDFPNDEGKPYKSNGGKMQWNDVLKREIPVGWVVRKLSDIANITMGQSPQGSSYNENNEGTIFYQGCADFGERFPDVRVYTTEPSRFAKKGDILMSVRAPVGTVNIANEDCCIGRGLAAINSKIGSMMHLEFIIKDFKTTFDNKGGTTFSSITKDELYNLPVIEPDKKILGKFEEICKPINFQLSTINSQLKQLTQLRDELLPLLMNGQVVVKN